MAILFKQIPANTRTPGVFVEFDASRARTGPALMPFSCLMPAHMQEAYLTTDAGIAAVASTAKLTRSTGDFQADGWVVGDKLRVAGAGSGANLGVVSTVLAVAALELTLEPGSLEDVSAAAHVLTRLTGTGTPGVPVLILDETDAEGVFGVASMGAAMARKWFENNRVTVLWGLPVASDVGGTAASASLTVSGTATASGTVWLMVMGKQIAVAVASGDTASDVATAIIAAVNAEHGLPVTASGTPPAVTLTFDHRGAVGNSVEVRVNYFQSQQLPPGITISGLGLFSGGAGVIDHDSAVPGAGIWQAIDASAQYHVIADPFNDAASLTSIALEMERRDDAMEMIDGRVLTTRRDTVGNLVTLGGTGNSRFISVMGFPGAPNAEFERTAAYAAAVAYRAEQHPAVPFQYMELRGILPPSEQDRFSRSERNTLLHNGIATSKTVGAVEVIERGITMYQTTPAGAPDTAYLDLNAGFQLSYLRFDFRTTLLAQYADAILVDDARRVNPGIKILSPQIGRTFAMGKFSEWEANALVEDPKQFEQDLQVERNPSDPNRMDFVLRPNLSNQNRVDAVRISFAA